MPFRMLRWRVLLAVAMPLVAQNAQVVGLRSLFWRLAMSQALLIVFVLAAGSVIGWIPARACRLAAGAARAARFGRARFSALCR